MTEMSAGRAVIELPKAEGVRHVFGIVGSTFLDVLDVLRDDRGVEYVNVRHEQAWLGIVLVGAGQLLLSLHR